MKTCFSLFSGIGGFDLAMKNKGIEIVGACEIDKYARSIYQKHFPKVSVWEDATKIKPEELPDFELLCAGFPCQTFSVAGKRLGLEDTRGTLFHEIARIARQKRPRYLLLENVRGLLYHDEGRTFTTIIQVFYELGYDLEWQVINSKYFVPQNRERIFILGHLRGESTRKIFPFIENGRVPVKKQKSTTVRTIMGGGHSGVLNSQITLVVNNHGNLEERGLCSNLDANYYKGCDTYGARSLVYHIKSNKQTVRVYDKNGICPTLGDGHGMQSPNIFDGKIRRLTPLECERLQGFKDDYTKYGKDGEIISDTQRYKCLGNAVTVPVIEYILERLIN